MPVREKNVQAVMKRWTCTVCSRCKVSFQTIRALSRTDAPYALRITLCVSLHPPIRTSMAAVGCAACAAIKAINTSVAPCATKVRRKSVGELMTGAHVEYCAVVGATSGPASDVDVVNDGALRPNVLQYMPAGHVTGADAPAGQNEPAIPLH